MARTSLTKALAALLAIAGLLAAMALDAGSRHVVLVLGASGTREGPFANAPVAGVCWTACVLSVLAAAGVVLEWRGARR